jgi:hypothetical protein
LKGVPQRSQVRRRGAGFLQASSTIGLAVHASALPHDHFRFPVDANRLDLKCP